MGLAINASPSPWGASDTKGRVQGLAKKRVGDKKALEVVVDEATTLHLGVWQGGTSRPARVAQHKCGGQPTLALAPASQGRAAGGRQRGGLCNRGRPKGG